MRILIIEDKDSLREMLTDFLENDNVVLEAESAEKGEQLLHHYPDVILCDLKLPGISGLDFIEKHSSKYKETYFIMMTAFGDIPTAVDAMKKGAYDFLPKPLDLNHLNFKLKKIKELINLKNKSNLQKETKIVFKSKVFNNILESAKNYSNTLSPVLITGESGTGKEVIAKYIHQCSNRKDEIFYSINCAAIPENLLESELFGYEEGAFTGANKRKKGILEFADNGTLFLDEIGDTSIGFQTKLLRVLEERKFKRVGGNSLIDFNIRFLFATNKDLLNLISNNSFREDLYYRISTFQIFIPPLRERKEDIKPLAIHFAEYFGYQVLGKPFKLTEKELNSLSEMEFLGNVRELKNYVERWVITGEKEKRKTNKKNLNSLINDFENKSFSEIIENVEKEILEINMIKYNGNKQAVSDKLKLNYKTLLSKLKKYEIK